ncbi:hypothetical protein ACLOJK_018865 [Asimina triloba]
MLLEVDALNIFNAEYDAYDAVIRKLEKIDCDLDKLIMNATRGATRFGYPWVDPSGTLNRVTAAAPSLPRRRLQSPSVPLVGVSFFYVSLVPLVDVSFFSISDLSHPPRWRLRLYLPLSSPSFIPLVGVSICRCFLFHFHASSCPSSPSSASLRLSSPSSPVDFDLLPKPLQSGKRKEEGNAYFKDGKYARASLTYDKTTKYVEFDSTFNDEQKKLGKNFKVTRNLNSAACKLKSKQYREATKLCSKVLVLLS